MILKYSLKVIFFLSGVKEATVKQICLAVQLKQPIICQICNILIERSWISVREIPHVGGKGRPSNVYKLKLNIEDIKNIYRIKSEEKNKNDLIEIFKCLNGE